MICKNCGAEITEDVKFCPECGKAIEEDVNDSQAADSSKKKKIMIIAGAVVLAIVALVGIYMLFWNKSSESKLSTEEQYILGTWQVLATDGEGSFTFESDFTGSVHLDATSNDLDADTTWDFYKESDGSYMYHVNIVLSNGTIEYVAAIAEPDQDDSYDLMVMGRYDDNTEKSITLYREKD